eukprot:Hpha_TRINITY_DN24683_c0_g1::TRINITY_DN24683_c0_g1_i1::g.147438::m.147438
MSQLQEWPNLIASNKWGEALLRLSKIGAVAINNTISEFLDEDPFAGGAVRESRRWLSGPTHRYSLRPLGLVLAGFPLLYKEGLVVAWAAGISPRLAVLAVDYAAVASRSNRPLFEKRFKADPGEMLRPSVTAMRKGFDLARGFPCDAVMAAMVLQEFKSKPTQREREKWARDCGFAVDVLRQAELVSARTRLHLARWGQLCPLPEMAPRPRRQRWQGKESEWQDALLEGMRREARQWEGRDQDEELALLYILSAGAGSGDCLPAVKPQSEPSEEDLHTVDVSAAQDHVGALRFWIQDVFQPESRGGCGVKAVHVSELQGTRFSMVFDDHRDSQIACMLNRHLRDCVKIGGSESVSMRMPEAVAPGLRRYSVAPEDKERINGGLCSICFPFVDPDAHNSPCDAVPGAIFPSSFEKRPNERGTVIWVAEWVTAVPSCLRHPQQAISLAEVIRAVFAVDDVEDRAKILKKSEAVEGLRDLMEAASGNAYGDNVVVNAAFSRIDPACIELDGADEGEDADADAALPQQQRAPIEGGEELEEVRRR